MWVRVVEEYCIVKLVFPKSFRLRTLFIFLNGYSLIFMIGVFGFVNYNALINEFITILKLWLSMVKFWVVMLQPYILFFCPRNHLLTWASFIKVIRFPSQQSNDDVYVISILFNSDSLTTVSFAIWYKKRINASTFFRSCLISNDSEASFVIMKRLSDGWNIGCLLYKKV